MTKVTKLTEEKRAILQNDVTKRGVHNVAKDIGMSREAVARLVAGIPARPGTVSLANDWFNKNQPK